MKKRFKGLRERLAKDPGPPQEGKDLDLEKGDLLAMVLAGFLTIGLPVILMTLVVFGVASCFFGGI